MNPFSLRYAEPVDFMICQWQFDKTKPNVKYLLYRTSVMLLFVTTWILSLVDDEFNQKWAIYVTNWGYTICTVEVTLVWAMLVAWTWSHRTNREVYKTNALKLYPVYYLLYTLATPLAFGITTIYWTDYWPRPLLLLDFLRHGNNSIVMLVDLWLVSHRLRYVHVVYPLLLGVVYSLFSYVYYALGGTNREHSPCIYGRLNWAEHPYRTALICLGIDSFLGTLHLVVVLSSRFRRKIEGTCKLFYAGHDELVVT
ncbi:unnamed protein product [Phyllotreta striolata]|uniref:Uncharacterized protein n=1 Tax=Phyllotreta striolata TaxID=444603 RepID=A0A9N9TLT8_PHYSR|nr:unnamed protein product [Phyllotreta striolata]